MDKRQQTCCFTGHRILPRGMEDELWTKTYAHLQPLLTQGVRYFGVGGALGFDTLIAERLLELRDIISPIKVILVLPFRSYQSRWTPEQQIRTAKIQARADKIVYCSDTPSRNAFLYRDRHLVNGSSYCIGYCTRTTGGSAYTLRYAREQGLTVWNIGEEVKP